MKFAAFLIPLFALAILIGCTPTDTTTTTTTDGYSTSSESMTASTGTASSAAVSSDPAIFFMYINLTCGFFSEYGKSLWKALYQRH